MHFSTYAGFMYHKNSSHLMLTPHNKCCAEISNPTAARQFPWCCIALCRLGHWSNPAGNCWAGSSRSAQHCTTAVVPLTPAGSMQKQFKCLCTVFATASLFKVTSFGIWRSICSYSVFCYCDVKCGIKNIQKRIEKHCFLAKSNFKHANPVKCLQWLF